jgi:hypothetical protein
MLHCFPVTVPSDVGGFAIARSFLPGHIGLPARTGRETVSASRKTLLGSPVIQARRAVFASILEFQVLTLIYGSIEK